VWVIILLSGSRINLIEVISALYSFSFEYTATYTKPPLTITPLISIVVRMLSAKRLPAAKNETYKKSNFLNIHASILALYGFAFA
jgi:hypothetical protein